jgi:hypothetical protein
MTLLAPARAPLPTSRPYSTNPEAIEKRLRKAGRRKRIPVRVSFRGVEGTIREMALLWGLSPWTLRRRLNHGWDVGRALVQPCMNAGPREHTLARLQAIQWRIEALELLLAEVGRG